MATTKKVFYPTKPGLEQAGDISHTLHFAPDEKQWAYMAANDLAAKEGKVNLLCFGGRDAYVAARVTETKDNSGTIAYAAAGVRLQTQATPTDNDDVDIDGIETLTLAAGKWYSANLRIAISSVANLGLSFGAITSGAQPLAANATDGVWFHKAKNAATIVGRVVENGNTAADSGTLATMVDATEIRLGFRFYCGTSAATSFGYWLVNGTVTNFTSAQQTALYNMVTTTAPTLAGHLGVRVNSTTQRNAVAAYALIEADR